MIQATPQATLWQVPSELNSDLGRLVKLEAQAKQLDIERQALKEKLLAWAQDAYVAEVRISGKLPGLPIRLIDGDERSLAYVLAAGTKAIPAEAAENLVNRFGNAIVSLDHRYSLDVNLPTDLRQEKLAQLLMEIFEDALNQASRRVSQLLSKPERSALLKVNKTTRLHKNALELVLTAIGKGRFPKVFESLLPWMSCYLKAS